MFTGSVDLSGNRLGSYPMDPYMDPYNPVFQQVWGNLMSIDACSSQIMLKIHSSTYTDSDTTNFQNELEDLGSKCNDLTNQLITLRTNGARPGTPTSHDDLIGKCNLLIKIFTDNAADPTYQAKTWHFHGIIGRLENLKKELINFTQSFVDMSLYNENGDYWVNPYS